MKKTKIFSIFASLLVMMSAIVLYSCSQSSNEVAPEMVKISSKNKDKSDNSVESQCDVYQHKEFINTCQNVIALSLLDLTQNPSFSQIVHSLSEQTYNNSDVTDYYADFKAINEAYSQIGGNLLLEMEASLLRNGGNTSSIAILRQNLFGITLATGTKIETGIRLSYKDGLYPVSNNVVVSTEQLHPSNAVPIWVYNDGVFTSSVQTMNYVNSHSTWNVNIQISQESSNHVLYGRELSVRLDDEGDGGRKCRRSLTIGCNPNAMGRRCRC